MHGETLSGALGPGPRDRQTDDMSDAKPPSRGLSKDISLDKMPETLGDNAYEVIIPPDSLPGDILRVTAGGKDYKITVPEGAEPGMALVFEGPKKKPVEPPADAPGEATQQSDPAKPMRPTALRVLHGST